MKLLLFVHSQWEAVGLGCAPNPVKESAVSGVRPCCDVNCRPELEEPCQDLVQRNLRPGPQWVQCGEGVRPVVYDGDVRDPRRNEPQAPARRDELGDEDCLKQVWNLSGTCPGVDDSVRGRRRVCHRRTSVRSSVTERPSGPWDSPTTLG